MLAKQLEQVKSAPDDKALEKSKSFTKDVQKASKSIQKLADHLRNFSRGMVEKYEVFDVFETITDAVFITGSKVTKTGSTVTNNVVKGRCFVNGLPNQLEQVFVNLIGNACDAMENLPRRELTISISPIVRDGVECWSCDVQDTGSGISPEIMDEIFHSFFTTKEKGKGTGLGLSISRGIVRDHKGDISLKSVVGQGSKFSVILPKAKL